MPLGDATSAGIAQLVERNLAKVEVASSNLVSRSIFPLEIDPELRRHSGLIATYRPMNPVRWISY